MTWELIDIDLRFWIQINLLVLIWNKRHKFAHNIENMKGQCFTFHQQSSMESKSKIIDPYPHKAGEVHMKKREF